ncbi:MAG: dehypoxanthine futalosine cyclase [Phycisphaerae bacterium]|nr:dehypoxanthine futalosine cyclase [Phycisphaerae bacterium]
MYSALSIHELGRRAFERAERLHPEPYRTYVVDRNINYANVCTSQCAFCNFRRRPGADDAYVLTYEQIGQKIEELLAIGGTQILMQGGLLPSEKHPSGHGRPFEWYLDLLRFVKKNYPAIHVHAFSPPEIWAFHKIFDLPLRDVLLRLRDAGLDTIPGGGGEILVDRVRRKIGPRKASTDEWLAVMRAAHHIGMKTSCTMMFGHIETIPERIEHLRRLRDLQDETGGFVAFIHWPFQPEGTPLGRWKPPPDDYTGPPDGEHLFLAGAHEYLKLLAVARLYLDNIPNMQSSWVTMGPKIGQLALFFGANDLGSVMMEENVVSAAGTTFRLDEEEIRRLITAAGWTPRQRDQYYRPIDSGRCGSPLSEQLTPYSF